MPNHPNLGADRTEGTGAMNMLSPPSIYVARSLPAAIDALGVTPSRSSSSRDLFRRNWTANDFGGGSQQALSNSGFF